MAGPPATLSPYRMAAVVACMFALSGGIVAAVVVGVLGHRDAPDTEGSRDAQEARRDAAGMVGGVFPPPASRTSKPWRIAWASTCAQATCGTCSLRAPGRTPVPSSAWRATRAVSRRARMAPKTHGHSCSPWAACSPSYGTGAPRARQCASWRRWWRDDPAPLPPCGQGARLVLCRAASGVASMTRRGLKSQIVTSDVGPQEAPRHD